MNKPIPATTMIFSLSMVIAIVSVVFYQLMQKAIAPAVNPAVSLILTYAVAMGLSAMLLFVYPLTGGVLAALKQANYATFLLGAAVVGIELGFLLIYRSGWQLGIAAPFSSSVTNILLISISLLIFKEHLSGLKLLGLAFCIVGIFLISYKR